MFSDHLQQVIILQNCCERCTLTTWLPSARMVAESPNSGDYFYLGLTLRKNLATCFGLTLMASVCLLNIPGLFLTDFDQFFPLWDQWRGDFFRRRGWLDLVYFSFMLYFLFTGNSMNNKGKVRSQMMFDVIYLFHFQWEKRYFWILFSGITMVKQCKLFYFCAFILLFFFLGPGSRPINNFSYFMPLNVLLPCSFSMFRWLVQEL